MTKKTILVDPSRCLQCSNCWVACKDEHCDNDWSPITTTQGPDQWWIKVNQWEEGSGRHMKMLRQQVMCQHCDECVLVAAAPDAVYKREDGIVIIDPEAAKGRKELVDLCPYHTVYWNEALQVAQKCTMCAHLIDAGWEKPRCVNACPADALAFVDIDELTDENLWAPLTKLHPEYGTKPSVVYVNQPSPFVSGEVISADLQDVVEDARITAVHQVTGQHYQGYSNSLGDFMVPIAKLGYYTVSFEAQGYKRKVMTDVRIQRGTTLEAVRLNPRVDAQAGCRDASIDEAALERVARKVIAEELAGADWTALVPQTTFEVKAGMFGSVRVTGVGGTAAPPASSAKANPADAEAQVPVTEASAIALIAPGAEQNGAADQPQGFSGTYDFKANTPLGKKKGKFVVHDQLDGTFTGTITLMGSTCEVENATLDAQGSFECDSIVTSPLGKMPAHTVGAIVDGRMTGKTITKVGEFEFIE